MKRILDLEKVLENNPLALKELDDSYKSDYEVVLKCVKHDARNFAFASENLKNMKSLALVALSKNGFVIRFLSDELKRDRDILNTAFHCENIKNGMSLLHFLPKDLLSNLEIIRLAFNQSKHSAMYIPNEMLNNKYFIKEVLKVNGLAFAKLDGTFRYNRELAMIAVNENGYAYRLLPSIFREDVEIMGIAVSRAFKIIEDIPIMLKESDSFHRYVCNRYYFEVDELDIEDEEYFLNDFDNTSDFHETFCEFLEFNGEYLKYLPAKYLDNIEYIKWAIKSYPLILLYINKKFSNSKELLTLALESDHKKESFYYKSVAGKLLHSRSSEIRKDKKYLLSILPKYKNLYPYIDASLKSDRDILKEALRGDSSVFYSLTSSEKEDKELSYIAVATNGEIIKDVKSEYLLDKDFAIAGILSKYSTYQYLNETLKNDEEIVKLALTTNGCDYKYLPSNLKDREDLIELALISNGRAIKYLSEEKKNWSKFITLALSSNPYSLEFLPDYIRDDKLIVQSLLFRTNGKVLKYASENLRNDKELIYIGRKLEEDLCKKDEDEV